MARHKPYSTRGGQQRTQRQLRVGEMLRHSMVALLERGELRDPDLVGVSITVTEVRVSPDLRKATFLVMPLGGQNVGGVVEALGRAAPFLRRQIAQSVKIKYFPALCFMADKAFDEGTKIDSILRSPRVAHDLQPQPPEINKLSPKCGNRSDGA